MGVESAKHTWERRRAEARPGFHYDEHNSGALVVHLCLLLNPRALSHLRGDC